MSVSYGIGAIIAATLVVSTLLFLWARQKDGQHRGKLKKA